MDIDKRSRLYRQSVELGNALTNIALLSRLIEDTQLMVIRRRYVRMLIKESDNAAIAFKNMEMQNNGKRSRRPLGMDLQPTNGFDPDIDPDDSDGYIAVFGDADHVSRAADDSVK